MGTRNNPSPGGLRSGLEITAKRTRTRKQPVRASKMATVQNASDSEGEVATMTEPRSQSQEPPNPFTFQPSSSAPRPQVEQALAESVEAAEPRPIAPLPTRRHNTRSSSRSVSPSLLNPEFTGRTEDPKPKGKGASRPRSTSASSTHQGVEATNERGGKRGRAGSEHRDVVDEQTTKRSKAQHTDPSDRPQSASRKRKNNLRNQAIGSPIPEVPEEEGASDNRVVKRNKTKLPQEELEFSYAHILNTYPPQQPRHHSQPAEERTQESISEPSTSRTPQATSINPTTSTSAPAQAESSQRSDAESKPTKIAEQRAVHSTPTLSNPQQPVIERTDAQSNGRRSDAEGIDQQRSILRNRSESTPPLPTLKNPHPTIRATATSNGSPILRQGLVDTRVAQGSARDGGQKIPSDPAEKQAYLQKTYGKSRSRVYRPTTKAVLAENPIQIFEDSEHEDDSEPPYSPEEFKGWKSDLRVAKSTYERVLSGERLPDAEPSSSGKEQRITRRKPGETPSASRPRRKLISLNPNFVVIPGRSSEEPLVVTDASDIDKLYALVKLAQSSETFILPSPEEVIELRKATKSKGLPQVRSAAPSPASQRANSQPPSNTPIQHHQDPHSPRDVSNCSGSASPSPSGGEAASHHSEMNQLVEDHESVALAADDQNNDTMSQNTRQVDANEAIPTLPTTPLQIPPQQASEPGAWSAVFTSVKKALSTPFKFFGSTPNAGRTATTNDNETEFTFTHPHKPAQPLTTPTRSSKPRVKPQSERRGTITNHRRVSNSARVPQTERQRRHVDKSTPLHLRGAPSASDRQHMYDQQASSRLRQREAETASLEQNELSHGKTFRAPSPLSDSDDSDEDVGADTDDDVEVTSSDPKQDWAFLNRNKTDLQSPDDTPATASEEWKATFERSTNETLDRMGKMWVKNARSAPKSGTNLNSRRVHFEDESTSDALDEPQDVRKRTGPPYYPVRDAGVRSLTRVVKLNPEDTNCPFYFVRDPEMRTQFFRKVHADDPKWEYLNMFGEEAWFYRLPPDAENSTESWTELTHGKEPYTRGPRKIQWDSYMKNEKCLEQEKNWLLTKWNRVEESKKKELLPRIKPFYRKLMKIGEYAENESSSTSTATSSDTPSPNPLLAAHHAYKAAQAQSVIASTNAANPSGTFKCPSDSGSDDEDEAADEAAPKVGSKQWDQTPPPKPRPGNAQLPQPQPTPARAALAASLANAHKPRPLLYGPSNLRNVTQMSPIQQADQENREKENENGAKETTTKVPAKETWVKEQDEAKMTPEERMRQIKEVHDLVMSIPDADLPVFRLPKTQPMDIKLPKGVPGKYSHMREDINAATKAAFDKMMGMKNSGGNFSS